MYDAIKYSLSQSSTTDTCSLHYNRIQAEVYANKKASVA